MNLQSKLAILADAAKYDASCASSGAQKRNSLGGQGVGSTEGGKIPVIADGVSAGDSNTTDHWVVDPDTGEPGISKMDEKNLKDIADEISGTYVAVNASQTLADSVSAKSSKQWRMTTTVKERTRTTPVVWPLAIALAILLAMEVGAWIATSRRLL